MTHGGARVRRVTPAIAAKIKHARNCNREPARALAEKYGLAAKTIYNIAGGWNPCLYEPDAVEKREGRRLR